MSIIISSFNYYVSYFYNPACLMGTIKTGKITPCKKNKFASNPSSKFSEILNMIFSLLSIISPILHISVFVISYVNNSIIWKNYAMLSKMLL